MTQEPSGPPPCDVIILTALPVEFRAVVAHLQGTQEVVHRETGTIYHQGSFAGEHRTWRVAVAEIGMGGVSAATETERAITFFRPQISLFVGIAGGLKDVRLGDVVAATKVYAYESGKAAQSFEPRPELWRASHALEQRARHEAHHDEWLARLHGSLSDPAPRASIGALAAGEKVLASTQSSVYSLLKATYGDALAVEMEGHGFLQAVHANQDIHGLVIRGISDLIDGKTVADAAGSQTRAARHAAAFAFQVLAKFTLPSRSGVDAPAAPQKPSFLHNIPYPRNPFFTGRDQELKRLHAQLQQGRTAAVGQTQSISGLGGIGKTQLVVEYAYRYHDEYQYVLWTRADSLEALNSSYTELATLLHLPEQEAQEQAIIVRAVKTWLGTYQNYLLVLDNADEPDVLVPFLPPVVGGNLLLTTRSSSVRRLNIASPLVLETLLPEHGALFLLHRSGLIAPDVPFAQASPEDQTLAQHICQELGGLPLAIEQAAAYIDTTGTSLIAYRSLYQQHRVELLKRGQPLHYPHTVATTWNISFQRVESTNPAAADLLRFCAFLAPDAIPEEILTEGASELGPLLAPVAADALLLNDAIAALRAYSLITRNSYARLLTVHRLVQAVQRDNMLAETRQRWMQRVVQAVEAANPGPDFANWPTLERLLPHALVCATWIEQAPNASPEASRLLNQTGYYLHARGRYAEAEPLHQRALAICEQQLGVMHPSTAQVLNNLAALYWDQGKYEQAEPLFQRALAICEQQLGASHPNTANSLNNLAELYRAQGKYEQAEPLFQRALAIREQQLGASHPNTANSLNNLALLYRAQGKYAEAEPLVKRALAIREQQLGPMHPDTATSLNNLALLYRAQGKYAEAEPLHQRALAICEQQLGAMHPSTAQVLNNLAALYREQGRYGEAEPLYQRALSILEDALGRNHPSTRTVRGNYATLLRSMGRNTEAKQLEEAP